MDRRNFMAASVAVSAIVAVAPALANETKQGDPVDRYWRAHHDYNAYRISEEAFDAAVDELDMWDPPTCRDFVRKYEAVHYAGAHPNEQRSKLIMEQARQLLRRTS